MIVAKIRYEEQRSCSSHPEIPAYIANGILVLGHNNKSNEFPYVCIPDGYTTDDFSFFVNHKYSGAKDARPHYLYKGTVPYELMEAQDSKGNLIYTFLMPCRNETYFCTCKDCGENFVIDCYETPYYNRRNLTMPTVRCKKCISQKNKN